MHAIERYEINTLVIAHQNRLGRCGFAWFAQFCADHGREVFVLNQKTLLPAQELVHDLMTIVHCFSSQLSGLRHYRRTLAEALQEPSL